MSDKRIEQSVVIETTPELAFEAVTAASELREWFSDGAWTEVRADGRYGLHWNQGYHVEGKFVELEAPHRAVVTWLGTGEPGETTVEFAVETVESGGTKVAVVHSGFGTGKAWDKAMAEAEKGWTTGLENLKSTLESGVDLRVARRPFLGILLALLDAERAEKEGIAVTQGIYINGTVAGSAAEAAGIGKGDVIVAIDGGETPGFQELTDVLRSHQVGDVVHVELVRGQQRETVKVTLGQRNAAGLPDTAEGLADLAVGHFAETDAEIKAALEGVTEEEAEQSPAEGEWSIKQVLAHLIVAEEDTHGFLAAIALDGWQDGGQGNPTAILGRLAAVQTVTPTLQDLVKRFVQGEAETAAFLRGLPEETLTHKARFHRITQIMDFAPIHTRDHIAQIQAVVEAVRGG
jgi:uncharacterized protein YndB with AHSA1/START domain/uncharacterized damage-inducible protein DinB